jgi:hypothetical protein
MSDPTTSPAPPPDPLDRHGGQKNLKYAVYGVRPVDLAYWADLGCTEVWQGESVEAKLPPEGRSSCGDHLLAAARCGMKVRFSAGLPRQLQKQLVNNEASAAFAGWLGPVDEIDNKVIDLQKRVAGGQILADKIEEYAKSVQATHGLKGPQGRYPVLGTFGHNARHLSSQTFLVDCYTKTLRVLDEWAFDEYRGASWPGPMEAEDFLKIAEMWDCVLGSMHSLANANKPWWLFVESGDIFSKGEGKHGATTEYVEFAIRYAHDRGAEGVCFFPLKVRGDFKWNVTTPETAERIKFLAKADLIELRNPRAKPVHHEWTSRVSMSDGSNWWAKGGDAPVVQE